MADKLIVDCASRKTSVEPLATDEVSELERLAEEVAVRKSAEDERQSARQAQRDAVVAAFDRIKQIRDFTGTATTAQLTDAVQDLAGYVEALAKLHLDELLGR